MWLLSMLPIPLGKESRKYYPKQYLTIVEEVPMKLDRVGLVDNTPSTEYSPQRIASFYDGRIFWRTDILIFWTDGFLDGRFQKEFLTDS